ncbi:MAG: GH25 family lysozyme [Clostridia bacterium]
MKFTIFKIGFIAICFSVIVANCMCAYATETTLSGIDVSDYQGTIDFSEVKDSGVKVVIIRVASGSDYEDSKWESNYESATDEGLYIGFYQYVTATSVDEAVTQAEYFYELVKDKTYDFGLVMDFEPSDELSTETINEIALAYLEKLETLTGETPIIYSDVSRINNVWDSSLSEYPLWVAEYDVSEPSSTGDWSEWIGFQYSDTGSINGIDGDVDLDYFKSSFISDDIDSTTSSSTESSSSTSSSTESNSSTNTYTVKAGDTLWKIALKYDTTVSTLVELNNISNPYLIYPNEVIIVSTTDTESNTTDTYTVKSGDTLWSIALKYDTTVSVLVELNNISNPDFIYPNEVLLLS